MIPEQTFETYPVFGDNATKVQPDAAKYAAGFQPADVLPAEWENWAWNKNTTGITDLNRGLSSVEKELNSILAVKSVTPAEGTNNQVISVIQSLISDAILAAHPVGSLYWSSKSTDPAQLFGGTWTQITDKFVWAKGSSDTVNATGGAKTVTLSIANLPAHTHTLTPAGSISSHSHTINNGNTSSSGTTTTAGFRGIAVTSGGSSASNTGSESGHTHNMEHYHDRGTMEITGTTTAITYTRSNYNSNSPTASGAFNLTDGAGPIARYKNHEDTCYDPKTLNINASDGWTGKTSGSLANATTGDTTAKTSTGAGTSHSHSMAHTHSVTASGYLYGKTDSTTPTFTGTQGTTSSVGSGTAVDKMPPYIVKYCWERTA